MLYFSSFQTVENIFLLFHSDENEGGKSQSGEIF